MHKSDDRVHFRMLGGSRQLLVQTGADLRRVADLDVAHWAVTALQKDSLIGDKEFLDHLDADGNGRIRCDEVKAALHWMLGLLRDLKGAETGSGELTIDSIYDNNPDGISMRESIRIALENMGLAGENKITFDQISNHEKIVSAALQNGDGIIPPDPVVPINPLAADCIRSIMTLVGKQTDLSGAEGVGKAEVESFEKQASGYMAWKDEFSNDLLVFGENTDAVYKAYSAIADKVDDFFRCAATLRYSSARAVSTYDPLDPESVKAYLEKSPIANPEQTQVLDLNCDLNPLWQDRVAAFFAVWTEKTSCNFAEWTALKAKLAPYGAWMAKKNTAIFDSFDMEKLRSYAKENVYAVIYDLIASDAAVCDNLCTCKVVRKLIIYQKNMVHFLNNFVCLHNLFDKKADSMIQVGHLVMDGRVFSLCTLVPNVAEHKKIVQESDICVMYLDITKGAGAALKTMKLAVAVTSGHVRNIFIGKSGVFFTEDGDVWDAKIFDFVKQPVSVSEAMREPFYKFAEFLQKQADKYFSSKSKTYENNVAQSIQTPAPPQQQTPAVSGSMMLMGGGIGIAAIGSAFAFMAKSLQGISAWTVLGVFLGILLIFGGPIITVSLIKLFQRNLSRFFEANGFAINMKMRLSLKMGRVFTYVPKMPYKVLLFAEQLNLKGENGMSKKAKVFLIILLLLLLGTAAYFLYPLIARCVAFFIGGC